MINTNTATGLVIAGAKVKKQLNGNRTYLVLEGSEEQIIGAFDTLYVHKAHNVRGEPEITNYQAYVTTTPEQVKHGLMSRAILRMMDEPSRFAFKHKAGGFKAQAEAEANRLWAEMETTRAVNLFEYVAVSPHKMGSHALSDGDMSGRD